MDTQELRTKWDGFRETELEQITDRVADFVDTMPERYAHVVKQVRRKIKRERRPTVGQWLRRHRWVPLVASVVGVTATIVVVTRARLIQS